MIPVCCSFSLYQTAPGCMEVGATILVPRHCQAAKYPARLSAHICDGEPAQLAVLVSESLLNSSDDLRYTSVVLLTQFTEVHVSDDLRVRASHTLQLPILLHTIPTVVLRTSRQNTYVTVQCAEFQYTYSLLCFGTRSIMVSVCCSFLHSFLLIAPQ